VTANLEDDLRNILANEIGAGVDAAALTDDFALIENHVLDSMGIFQLVEMIEDRFEVEIADDELAPEHFESITSIAKLVRSKTSG
jgi:acyl carrier protein